MQRHDPTLGVKMLQVFSRTFVSSSRRGLAGVLVSFLACAGALVLSGCGGGGGGSGAGGVSAGGRAQLVAMHFGRLADVYGFRSSGGAVTVELYQKDVMVGPDIQDERDGSSTRRDDEILYDFVTADPDTLQPRLLITRTIGSAEFQAAFDALDDRLRL
ncbi:MAG: hypothetical protein IT458_05705, partial [Planctomycetes bacterium]|nr:hypothetical protein [Planctomycetota bacterium]